ncbi:MAG: T9SS type A sorting domain-containing protein [Bacteroidota bacterium]
MKKTIFFFLTAFSSFPSVFAQLSGGAQVLYDSAYAQDPSLVNYATTNGAQVLSTPDSNSFYLKWFPTGAIPNATPLIVTLHGSQCNAFMEFKSWHPQAELHGCGIIALQWYRYNNNPPYDYFPDDTLYNYIDSVLTNISYPSGKALLHGFSRGSARSYAMIFYDIQSANNYFCTTVSNAGYVDLGYPLYDSINDGVYGLNFFAGKHWNLFCGPPEPPIAGGACDGLNFTQTWLQNQGAAVDIYIQDSSLGHNGFQLPSSFAYKDTMLSKYLECYNGINSVYENPNENKLSVFPNPFSSQTTIQLNKLLENATLTVYNVFGQEIKQVKNITGQEIIFNRDNLPGGFYFINLTQGDKIIAADKLVIID